MRLVERMFEILRREEQMEAQLIDYFQDTDGRWRFRIKGENGEIVVTSEGYESQRNARRGVGDLKRILQRAPVL